MARNLSLLNCFFPPLFLKSPVSIIYFIADRNIGGNEKCHLLLQIQSRFIKLFLNYFKFSILLPMQYDTAV